VVRQKQSKDVDGVELWGTAGKSTRRRTGGCRRRFVFPRADQAVERGTSLTRRVSAGQGGDGDGSRVRVLEAT